MVPLRGVPCVDVGLALKASVISRRFLSVVVGSLFVLGSATNSPGTIRGSPYTSSADDVSRSSFRAVRIPSNVYGKSSTQRELVIRACGNQCQSTGCSGSVGYGYRLWPPG